MGNTFRTLSIETSIGQIQIHGVRSANDLDEQYRSAADPRGNSVEDGMYDGVQNSARQLKKDKLEKDKLEKSELLSVKGPTGNMASIIARLLIDDERKRRE